MVTLIVAFLAIIITFVLFAAVASRIPARLRPPVAALIFFAVGGMLFLSSVTYVGPDKLGVVILNVGTRSLPADKIIATSGEKGPQARVLAPGWHAFLWPVIYNVEVSPLVEVKENEVGLITTTDGKPLPDRVVFAPEWPETAFEDMLDAEKFLTTGGGFKGPQTTVLTPGKYRLNPKLYTVEKAPITNVEKATVAVIKSNVGGAPTSEIAAGEVRLVERGERGIWREPVEPQKLYLNTRAYEVTPISTAKRVIRYVMHTESGGSEAAEEREIIVRSSDGFTFPVDVRIEYEIRPQDASLVVAHIGGDDERLRGPFGSAVRAIFRNGAETVKALDYVKQRSQQERMATERLAAEMRKIGVTITAVRIGNVGDEKTLGELLKTQTSREIALQEQLTFQEQQRAAEQKKALSRTTQEAEEEKRLATAQYEVKIADQTKERRILEAQAEAEAIRIRADAQAKAFAAIASEIGQANAALLEMLKIVGEKAIQITPRVLITGRSAGDSADAPESAALMGTMLDYMLNREEPPRPAPKPTP